MCAAYAATHSVQFGKPDGQLGNARTAAPPGGTIVGVRAPMHETEQPVIRPYWLVDVVEEAFTMGCGGGKARAPHGMVLRVTTTRGQMLGTESLPCL